MVIVCLCLAWGMCLSGASIQLSDKLSKGGQDDFFKPYFMRAEFNPLGTVKKSIEIAGAKTDSFAFVDFAADCPSIIFYGRLLKVNDGFWIFDRPNRKASSLGNAESIHVITRTQGEMESIAERFNIKSYELTSDCGYQKIYLAKLK